MSSGPHNTTARGAWDKILVSRTGKVRLKADTTYGASCPKEVYNPRNLKEAGMKRLTVLGALLVIGGLSAAIVAQQQPPRPPLPDLTKVKDNLYVITSSALGPEFTGGNTGVLVTESGVIVVDTKLSGCGPTILERIKKVTDKPVTMIINTHTHGDHTGSNEGFPATVDIVAHENTKANMAKMDAFK